MGLDMNLMAVRYLYQSETEDAVIGKKVNAALNISEDFEVQTISIEVGYWRKANHIHKWFVGNVQNGKDDCGSYYLKREKLLELKNVCEKVLQDNNVGPDILPTQSGFFFGNTEYNDVYIGYIKKTIEIIDKALSLDENKWAFKYVSSW
jgi:hypothetical protein